VYKLYGLTAKLKLFGYAVGIDERSEVSRNEAMP
jgi:hypothetical protein